jgi:hypothetical protein
MFHGKTDKRKGEDNMDIKPLTPEEIAKREANRLRDYKHPGATEYITISVAEYHCLTKAAAMLETILADKTYNHAVIVEAVRNAVQEMQRTAEAGAAE